jgi:hypothetical protein
VVLHPYFGSFDSVYRFAGPDLLDTRGNLTSAGRRRIEETIAAQVAKNGKAAALTNYLSMTRRCR